MPVLRPRFLNPGKIALLHVIGLYCHGAVPAEATIDVLSFVTSHLVPTFTASKSTNQLAITIEDLHQVLDIPRPHSAHKTLWQSFSVILCLHQTLDDLFDFFGRHGRLDRLFSIGLYDEGSSDDADKQFTRLEPTSLFGTFVRRSQLEFDRLTFHEAISLWRDFVQYRAPAISSVRELLYKRDADDLESFVGGSDGRFAEILSLTGDDADFTQSSSRLQRLSNSSSDDFDAYEDNGLPEKITKDDMEKLLEFQVSKMQSMRQPAPSLTQNHKADHSTGLGAPLPKELKCYLSQTLTTKEDASGLTHYAR